MVLPLQDPLISPVYRLVSSLLPYASGLSLLLVSVALLLLKPAVCCLRSVVVVNTRSAREQDHVARTCVFDQMFVAQDMMKEVRILNAKLGRGITPITVDCAAGREFFAHTVMVVDMLTTRLAR